MRVVLEASTLPADHKKERFGGQYYAPLFLHIGGFCTWRSPANHNSVAGVVDDTWKLD